jgi:hypothetical protein
LTTFCGSYPDGFWVFCGGFYPEFTSGIWREFQGSYASARLQAHPIRGDFQLDVRSRESHHQIMEDPMQ